VISAMVAGGAQRVQVVLSSWCPQSITNAKRKQNLGAEETRGKLRLSLILQGMGQVGVKSFNIRPTDGSCQDHRGIVNGSGPLTYLDQSRRN